MGSKPDMLTHVQFVGFAAVWGVLLIPVPFSRLELHDHTPKQVMVGSMAGMIEAIIWFFVVRKLQRRHNHRLGDIMLSLFKHNYALPRYEVKSRWAQLVVSELATPEQIEQAQKEMKWYLEACSSHTSADRAACVNDAYLHLEFEHIGTLHNALEQKKNALEERNASF